MKRTTIFLSEALERQLRQFARRSQRPVAQVVRDAIKRHLDEESLPSLQLPPAFDSGRSDISSRLDEFVFRDLEIHGDAPVPVPVPGRRRRK